MAAPYSTSDKYAPIIEEWNRSMRQFQPSWQALAALIDDNGVEYRQWADMHIGTLQDWDGVSPVNLTPVQRTHVDTYTLIDKAAGYTLKYRDVQADPTLVARKTDELRRAVQRTIEAQFYATLLDGFMTLTIDDGADATTPLFSAWHAYDDLTTPNRQSNLLNAVLSQSALRSAKQRLIAWRMWQPSPDGVSKGRAHADLGHGPFALVVPPALEDVARQIVGSQLETKLLTGTVPVATGGGAVGGATGGDKNVRAEEPWTVVASPYLGTEFGGDDNDWYVVDKTLGPPFKVWVPFLPSLRIKDNDEDFTVKIAVAFSMQVIPPSGGLGVIASNV